MFYNFKRKNKNGFTEQHCSYKKRNFINGTDINKKMDNYTSDYIIMRVDNTVGTNKKYHKLDHEWMSNHCSFLIN